MTCFWICLAIVSDDENNIELRFKTYAFVVLKRWNLGLSGSRIRFSDILYKILKTCMKYASLRKNDVELTFNDSTACGSGFGRVIPGSMSRLNLAGMWAVSVYPGLDIQNRSELLALFTLRHQLGRRRSYGFLCADSAFYCCESARSICH